MKLIVNNFIMRKATLVSVIHFSEELKQFYGQQCEKLGGFAEPLGLAKHRFSCLRKVLAAHVNHMHAFFNTAIYIVRTRRKSSKEYKAATEHLGTSPETFVQIGMMADAAEEVMDLLRFVDVDEPDVAMLGSECKAFVAKADYMWKHSGVFAVDGYTSKMLKLLAKPVTYQLDGQLITAFGCSMGRNHPVVHKCMQRMQCWRALALQTLDTEYPNFELCRSFSALGLGNQRCHDLDATVANQCLERLGKAFKCNHYELQRQIRVFKPAASSAYTAGVPTLEAWRRSLMRGTRSKMPSTVLRNVVAKYAACSVSTHKIDTDFSRWQMRTQPQQDMHRASCLLNPISCLSCLCHPSSLILLMQYRTNITLLDEVLAPHFEGCQLAPKKQKQHVMVNAEHT